MNTHRLMEAGSNIALHTLALLAGVILVILGLGLGRQGTPSGTAPGCAGR